MAGGPEDNSERGVGMDLTGPDPVCFVDFVLSLASGSTQ